MSWGGGTVTGFGTLDIASGATLEMGSSGNPTQTLNGVELQNAGTVDLYTAVMALDNGAGIDNQAGASFTLDNCCGHTGNDTISSDGTATYFTNAGSLTEAAGVGTGISYIQPSFSQTNTGSILVQAGALNLSTGANAGTVTVGSGATLNVGAYTQTAGSTVLSGGTINGPTASPGVRDFSIPIPNENPDLMSPGPDGNVWFVEGDLGSGIGTLVKITPAGQITQVPTPLPVFDFVFGPDGNIWFSGHDYIGEMTQQGGLLHDYAIPSADDPNSSATETAIYLTLGPDGNLWYTDPYVSSDIVGRLTPSGQITEYPIGFGSNGAANITSGSDGNIWFEATGGGLLGRITPTGVLTVFNEPYSPAYRGLTSGPNGNLWATGNNTIWEFNTAGQLVADFPASGSPYFMTVGPDGNLWYDENAASNIGRITPQGAVTEFPIPGPNSSAGPPIAGPDGNIWFGEYPNKIGEVVLNPASAISIQGGALSGTGTINADVTNGGGQVIPGGAGASGTLTINGNYTQTSTGALDIDIGGTTAGTQFDQLAISGSATLGGTMNISLINAFQPTFGNSFQVLTFGSPSGNFSTYNGTSLASGLFLDPAFNPTDLTLNIDQVAITGAPTFPLQGTPINLAALVTGPSAGDSFTFAWNATQNGNPFSSGSGATFTFTPNLSATYLVTLGVTDVIGGKGTVTLSIVVAPTIFVLDPSAAGSLSLSGNASIHIGGGVYVDSKSPSALSAGGSAQLSATSIQAVGGVSLSGSATLSGALSTGAASLADPLMSLTGPSTAGLTTYGSASYTSGSHPLAPGIYSQISASGSASLVLGAGLYLIEGGGFTVTGNASASGNGLTIYNTSSAYPSANGNYGGITLSGKGTISLTAATTAANGAYPGILIFQPRANTRALSLGGNGTAGLNGTLYAATAQLTVSGNAKLNGSVIVDRLSLSGNGASTQVADGSAGSALDSANAGTLLAGNVSVYVNDPAGYFTLDELGRIKDAINTWDSLLAPYNVTITEVSDPALATVVLDNGTTSAAGSAGSGVLGSYSSTGEITILQGWNWYAGANAAAIGADQYDFQTVVTHELGHALGLGGSADSTSPMYEVLATATVRRTPTAADLDIPEAPAGADPELAARFNAGAVARPSSPVAPAVSVVWGTVPSTALASGQWSVVSGQSPAFSIPTSAPVGLEPTLVVQGGDHDQRRELSMTAPDTGRVLDSALRDLVTDADRWRGEGADAEGTDGRALRGAGDVEDNPAPERIPPDRTDPAETARPVGLPLPVRPSERGLIRMDAMCDSVLDELAAATVGWPGLMAVPVDPVARPAAPPEPSVGLAKLAATLIVAGSWGHCGRFRGVTSRPAGRPRYRKDPE
jgi:virginiamycin B lyase